MQSESFLQGGSSDFEYTGYDFKDGTCIESAVYYCWESLGNYALYDDYSQALKAFFEKYNIKINSESLKPCESILSEENDSKINFEFLNIMIRSDWVGDNEFDYKATLYSEDEIIYINNAGDKKQTFVESSDDTKPEYSNELSAFVSAVEAAIVESNYNNLDIDRQKECKGFLFDLDGDDNDELILRTLNGDSINYEIWSIKENEAVCVNCPILWGQSASMYITEMDGYNAIVYKDRYTGSSNTGESILVYSSQDIPYKQTHSFFYSNMFDADDPDENGEFYSVDENEVDKNEYNVRQANITNGIELFVAGTQYEGLSFSELLQAIK